MKYLPIIILLSIIILKFIAETKGKSTSRLFAKIYLATLLLGIFIAPFPFPLLIMFSSLLAWPVYSCWMKPNNILLWRVVSVLFLIVSYTLPIFTYIKFGSSLDFIVGKFLTSLVIMIPLHIVSLIEIKYRLKN